MSPWAGGRSSAATKPSRDWGLRFASARRAASPRARASGAPGSIGARGFAHRATRSRPRTHVQGPTEVGKVTPRRAGTKAGGLLGAAVSRALRRPEARRPRSLRGRPCGLAFAATKRCCCGAPIRVPNDSRVPPEISGAAGPHHGHPFWGAEAGALGWAGGVSCVGKSLLHTNLRLLALPLAFRFRGRWLGEGHLDTLRP